MRWLAALLLPLALLAVTVACEEEEEEAATATPSPEATPTVEATPPPAATPEPTPEASPEATPTPIVFNKGDEDLTFHLDTDTYELAWDIECRGTQGPTLIKVLSGGFEIPCTDQAGVRGTGSTLCLAQPGDYELQVELSWLHVPPGPPGSETPPARVQVCQEGWDWRITITPQ